MSAGYHHRLRAADERSSENRQLLVPGLIFVLLSGCSVSLSTCEQSWWVPLNPSQKNHVYKRDLL